MALKVLKQQAETPVQSGGRDFPAGVWRFTILEPKTKDGRIVRTRPTPDFMHNEDDVAGTEKLPRVSGAPGSGEIMPLWLGNAVAQAEGQTDAGEQKFFQDFVIKDGDVSIDDLDTENPPAGCGWQILRDARLLANLAIALGATTEMSEGDQTYVTVVDNFLELLKDGSFDGQDVIGNIEHQPWRHKKSGKSGVNVVLTQFTGV